MAIKGLNVINKEKKRTEIRKISWISIYL